MLEPYLTERLNQTFPNPSDFKKLEEFTYASLAASAFKKVMSELLAWVEGQRATVETLEKKKKGEVDNFEIGGEK